MTSMLPRRTTISKNSHGCGHSPEMILIARSRMRKPPPPSAINQNLRGIVELDESSVTAPLTMPDGLAEIDHLAHRARGATLCRHGSRAYIGQ
jgi:hypothetical protein